MLFTAAWLLLLLAGKTLPRGSCAKGALKFPRGTAGVLCALAATALLLLLLPLPGALLLHAMSTGSVPTTGAKAESRKVKLKALGVGLPGLTAAYSPQGSPVRACSVR